MVFKKIVCIGALVLALAGCGQKSESSVEQNQVEQKTEYIHGRDIASYAQKNHSGLTESAQHLTLEKDFDGDGIKDPYLPCNDGANIARLSSKNKLGTDNWFDMGKE